MSDLIRYWRDRIEQAKPGLVVIDPDTLSTLLDLAEKGRTVSEPTSYVHQRSFWMNKTITETTKRLEEVEASLRDVLMFDDEPKWKPGDLIPTSGGEMRVVSVHSPKGFGMLDLGGGHFYNIFAEGRWAVLVIPKEDHADD